VSESDFDDFTFDFEAKVSKSTAKSTAKSTPNRQSIPILNYPYEHHGPPSNGKHSTEPALGCTRSCEAPHVHSRVRFPLLLLFIVLSRLDVSSKYEMTMMAYERNTGHPHPLDTVSKASSTDLLKRASKGTIPLTNQGQYLWYGSLTIGTPPQDFTGRTLTSVKSTALIIRHSSSGLRYGQL
jgi:hypothetical protein